MCLKFRNGCENMSSVKIKGTTIEYEMQYKNVKNINLRIRADGSIHISANERVPRKMIDEFIVRKSNFILNALEKCQVRLQEQRIRYFAEDEICDVIIGICKKVYPYYEKIGIDYPQIRFRKMVSRWGSCQPMGGILTFNTNLMFAPLECIEYVVWHEFTHFLQPNHSKMFYEELCRVCPGWKEFKKQLKEINIREIEND